MNFEKREKLKYSIRIKIKYSNFYDRESFRNVLFARYLWGNETSPFLPVFITVVALHRVPVSISYCLKS